MSGHRGFVPAITGLRMAATAALLCLASCTGAGDGTSAAPTISPAASLGAAVKNGMQGVQYPLYTVHFEIKVTQPDGAVVTKTESTFSGFVGQHVKWISGSTNPLAPSANVTGNAANTAIQGATTGIFACVRFLGESSARTGFMNLGMDYSYSSLRATTVSEPARTASPIIRKSANMADLMVPLERPMSVNLGNGALLIMQATRTLVDRDDAIAGMDNMRRQRSVISTAAIKAMKKSEDSFVTALTGRPQTCN